MGYEPFKILKTTAVPLPIENVDTDQIIQARFLKAEKEVWKNLFRDWRFRSDNTIISDFVLNNPIYKGKILCAGKNFGSGSSREHAAWAIYDYGFRCVISSFFADIFKNNCLNIGVLPLKVSEENLVQIFDLIYANPSAAFEINLEAQLLIIAEKNKEISFEIDAYKKNNLMNGFDDIDYLISIKDEIVSFSEKIKF